MKNMFRMSIAVLVLAFVGCGGKQVKDLDAARLKELQQLGLDLESPIDRNTMMGGAVQAVILSHTPELQTCYRNEQKKNPNLEGNVTVAFTFELNGKISKFAIAKSTLKNENVHACMKKIFLTMDFPTSDQPMDTSYTIKFTQEK